MSSQFESIHFFAFIKPFTIPILTMVMFSARGEHQESVARYEQERPDGPVFSCAACKVQANTASDLWLECLKNQKLKIFGSSRSHSCDVCDIHLSEAEWLEKHMQGEKHKWIAKRGEQLLPVQWEPQEMCVVQKVKTLSLFLFNSNNFLSV